MSKPDTRLRIMVLTLLLVVLLASLVHYWPDQTRSNAAIAPTHSITDEGPTKRHFDWAVHQLKMGRYQQAINGFRAVLEHAPAMPEAYINTGFAQIALQRYEQAVRSFRTAIDLRPGQVNAYWGLAVSLEGLCDFPAASGAMRTYIHLAAQDDPFLDKAYAAIWEWEQMKKAGHNHDATSQACQHPEPAHDKT